MKTAPTTANKSVTFNDTIHYNDLDVGSLHSKESSDASGNRRSEKPTPERRWSWESKSRKEDGTFSSAPPAPQRKRSIDLKGAVAPPSVPQRKGSIDDRSLSTSSDHGPRRPHLQLGSLDSLDRRPARSRPNRRQRRGSLDHVSSPSQGSASSLTSTATPKSNNIDPWSPLVDGSEHTAPEIPERYFSDDELSLEDDFAEESSDESFEDGERPAARHFEEAIPPPPFDISVSCDV